MNPLATRDIAGPHPQAGETPTPPTCSLGLMSTGEAIQRAALMAAVVFSALPEAQLRYRYISDRRRARRFYWTTAAIGMLCMIVGVGRVWPSGLAAVGFFGSMHLGFAYLASPYLKINGRIYALTANNRQPDPVPGMPHTPAQDDGTTDRRPWIE